MAGFPRKPVLPREDQAAQAVEERLRQIAARFAPAIRERTARLLMAAAEAILQLTDLDLVRHEGGADRVSHSLAVWEELAPVMGATVTSVNTMLAIAQDAFPPPPESGMDDGDFDQAFGPEAVGQEPAPRQPDPAGPDSSQPASSKREPAQPETEEALEEHEIASLVAAVASGLRRDVARLGERLRNPIVVADPWNLVSDLLEFRGRLRAGIGELIFQVAIRVDEADRSQVVPGYAADLDSALLIRQSSTNLSFLFRGHTRRIASVAEDRIVAALADALKDLQSFSRTRALPALRTADKRIFLEARAHLFALHKQRPADPRAIRAGMENLARFLDSLSVISRRENLRLHDRAQLAAAGRHLEQAQELLDEPSLARAPLTASVRSASALYGRDAQLDAYLRAQRHFPVDWLADAGVAAEVESFGALLAGIASP